jgi:ribonuclease Z
MRLSFHHRLVNGPFEDPCLYIRLPWQKRALLMDAGDISGLSPADVMKITDVFVTHTHIDHFIGFDAIVRALLGRELPVSFHGPAEIIDRIEGRLRGYSWNLIEDYPLRIEVFGIKDSEIRHSSFHAKNCFRRKDIASRPFTGTVLEDESFRVEATLLDHDIPCLAFSMREDIHVNIDKAALLDMGLSVGPWLAELKKAVREGAPDSTEFTVLGKAYSLGELRRITRMTKGQKISYVTDASPTDKNVGKIVELVRGADTLYCEAYFLEEDRQRAVERNHLTARMAGRIARSGRVKNLVAMHFSPRYRHTPHTPHEEAMEEFLSTD